MITIKQAQERELRAERKMKPVRIDHKTTIFVSTDIPDGEAIRLWKMKIEDNKRKYENQNNKRWSE